MDDATFLGAIRAARLEDHPREVYADWLDTGGRALEAAVVRAEIALYAADPEGAVPERDRLHTARAAAPARWLAAFEQPSTVRAPLLPIPPAWWASELGAARPADGTYQCYDPATLPDLDPDRSADLGWLGPSTPCPAPPELEAVAARAAALGYRLPAPFVALMRDLVPTRKVIHSCTGCYFSLDPELWSPAEALGGLLVPFYNDSQSCVSWGMWVHRTGAHAVVSFGCAGDDEDEDEPQGVAIGDGIRAAVFWLAAPSLPLFVYRFALENRIWYALNGMRRDQPALTDEERAYLAHYGASSTPSASAS